MASAVSDAQTLETIHAIHQRYGYILDPHGAVGMTAALRLQEQLAATQPKGAIISLACAHPAKFPEAVGNALGQTPPSHPLLESQANLPEDYRVVPNDFSAVKPLFL
jgi:threonine synthase